MLARVRRILPELVVLAVLLAALTASTVRGDALANAGQTPLGVQAAVPSVVAASRTDSVLRPDEVTATPTPTIPVPKQVSGLVGWYDAGQLAAGDGDKLSAWTDASGNGRDLVALASYKPTYRATGVGQQPALQLAGDSFLWVHMPLTTFAVFTVLQTTDLADHRILVVDNDVQGGTGPAGVALGIANGGLGIVYDNVGWGSGTYVNVADSTPHVTRLEYFQGSALFLDGDPTAIVTYSPRDLSSDLTVGATFGSGQPLGAWTGYIAEIVVYDHVLSGSETAQLEAYLGGKYGV